jgi:hypothetical protein
MPDAPNTDPFTPPPGSPGLPKAQPTGRALEDQWMSFANNELGQKGQVGVVGGNAQANAGAAAARWNLGSTVDQYNTKYGATARAVGEDKIDFGDGRGPVDVIEGGGNNSKWWYGSPGGGSSGGGGTSGDWGPGGTNPGGGGYGYGGGGGSGSGGGSWSGPQGGDGWFGTTPGQGTDLYNQLMARSKQGLAIDKNDPIIRNQADAHNVGLERGRTQYLQQEAERGGANSNMGAERRASAEKVGQGSADFEAALMGREVAARREEIQSALSGMGALLTAEQQLQLQEELAQLSRSESRYQFDAGLGQRESEFGRDLGQRGYEFDNNDRYRNSPLGPGN